MDTTSIVLGLVFLFAASLVGFFYLSFVESTFVKKQQVKKRLQYISAGGLHGQEKLINYQKNLLKNAGGSQKFVISLPRISSLDRMLIKAGISMSPVAFMLVTILLGCLGGAAGIWILSEKIYAVFLGFFTCGLPYLYLKFKEKIFMVKFEEQLPEALDLLTRALRSGHALSSGLNMVASEMGEPIKSEFSATVDEINLGLTLKEALYNMCKRVPSTDLNFFSIAVLIQKETGGNLAEILSNIGQLIRERIKFKRQVKALTAQGRFSAVILVLLPLAMFAYLYFAQYDYVSLLWRDSLGYILLCASIVMQIIGSYLISKIVKIEI